MAQKNKIPTLDLHGKRVDEIFDLMDRFLRKEESAGHTNVRILHGVGTGKVKERAIEYCRQSGHTPKPDKDASGRANPGSFLLFL